MVSFAKPHIAFLIISAFVLSGCTHKTDDKAAKVWTTIELKSLQGKTRDEVRELLGPPDGIYTLDSKGRWHYSRILLSSEGVGKPKPVWLFIYFTQLGEQRVSSVDINDSKE